MPEALSSVTALPMSGCSFTSTQFWLPRAVPLRLWIQLLGQTACTRWMPMASAVRTMAARL